LARSLRTLNPHVLAQRRLPKQPDGLGVLPRIVERRPRQGDSYPLTAADVRGALSGTVPLEYFYGLRRIELRPRTGEVGKPFALYRRDEKHIVLYSLPLQWSWNGFSAQHPEVKTMRAFGASVIAVPSGVTVSWRHEVLRAVWFYASVFGHELGHHFRHQYRSRRRFRGRRPEEVMADVHALRLFRTLLRLTRDRKRRAAEQADAADKAQR
jgi:hypothetical protein